MFFVRIYKMLLGKGLLKCLVNLRKIQEKSYTTLIVQMKAENICKHGQLLESTFKYCSINITAL